jgi:hypothetical protein
MGFCQEYWQFLIVIGILGGTGTSFIFIVPVDEQLWPFDIENGPDLDPAEEYKKVVYAEDPANLSLW